MKLSRLIFISFIIVSCQTNTAPVENSNNTNREKSIAFIHGIDSVFKDKFHISIKEVNETGDTFATGLTGLSNIKNIEVALRSKTNNYKLNISDHGEIQYKWVSVDTYSFSVIMKNKDSLTFSARLEPNVYKLTIDTLQKK